MLLVEGFHWRPQRGLVGANGAVGKESACQCRRCKGCGFNPWVGKILWRKKWQPTPVFWPGKFHQQRSLVDYSPWGHKELDTTEHRFILSYKKHEMWFKGERALLSCSESGNCLSRSLLRALPTPSPLVFESLAPDWLGARGPGKCSSPECFQDWPENSALEGSRCFFNLHKPQENSEQWPSQSWQPGRLSSRPPPFHLSPFLLKPVECCLIRIKGAWAAPGYN